MKTIWLILLAVLITALIAGVAIKLQGGKKARGRFGKRALATANEQGMFWRLVECFPQPEHVVLMQVSFGALLTAKEGASRYSFSQKRADFVLTDKSFKVLAVIELDDSSHKGQEDRDAQRDAMLIQAGYKVMRYARIPDAMKLKSDITTRTEQLPPMRAER
jgi:hypothetical protein